MIITRKEIDELVKSDIFKQSKKLEEVKLYLIYGLYEEFVKMNGGSVDEPKQEKAPVQEPEPPMKKPVSTKPKKGK